MGSTLHANALVLQFRRDLRHATKALPRQQRRALLDDIDAHLDEALPPDATDSDVRAVLDSLGDAEAIAAAATPAGALADRRIAPEVWALVMLTIGSLLPVLGWAIGLALLWRSRRWSTRDKLLGTLVWPGGMQPLWIMLAIPSGSTDCVNSVCTDSGFVPPPAVGVAILVILVAAPAAVLVHLARGLRHGA